MYRALIVLFVAGVASLTACRESTSASSAVFATSLSGAREIPPNATPASGSATFSLTGKTLTYEVTAAGFTTPLLVAHLQIGSATQSGPVIVPFEIQAQSGAIAHGSVDLGGTVSYNTLTISGDSLRALLELGLTYVNLHTAAYPGGEIRGQVVPR